LIRFLISIGIISKISQSINFKYFNVFNLVISFGNLNKSLCDKFKYSIGNVNKSKIILSSELENSKQFSDKSKYFNFFKCLNTFSSFCCFKFVKKFPFNFKTSKFSKILISEGIK
jgi:hypothetical protein